MAGGGVSRLVISRILNHVEKTADARTVLRTVRRHGPGRLRAAALDALAYLDGEAGLDPADMAAVERLIRIRRRSDPVRPVMSIGTTWWCVRGMDQATMLASLGLADPRPVTFASRRAGSALVRPPAASRAAASADAGRPLVLMPGGGSPF